MLVTSILLIASSAFTQGNFYQRVTKDMEQRDKEKKSLTNVDIGNMVTKIQSLDGIVKEQGETVEYVVCKIHF